jgi:Methylmalonyl Co-A mutase-associated GTPase MeaB
VTRPALAERVLAGDPRGVARALSLIENEAPQAADVVRAIGAHTGRAYLVGITGPAGVGKRALVDRLWMQGHSHEALAPDEFEEMLSRIAARTLDPYTATTDILERTLARSGARR